MSGESEFFDFLERSLEALRREVPDAYARLRDRLGDRAVHVEVDGRARGLSFVDGGHRLHTAALACALEFRTSRGTLIALVEGKTTLRDAAVADELWLRGSPADIADLYDALIDYLRGAARSRSMPALLRAYLNETGTAPAHDGARVDQRPTTRETHDG